MSCRRSATRHCASCLAARVAALRLVPGAEAVPAARLEQPGRPAGGTDATVLERNAVGHDEVIVPLPPGLHPPNPKLAGVPPAAAPSGALKAAPAPVACLDDPVGFPDDPRPKCAHLPATLTGRFTRPQAAARLLDDETAQGESTGARIAVRAR